MEFKTNTIKAASLGWVAKYGIDVCPEGTWWQQENWEVREEGALSNRKGTKVLTVAGGNNAPLSDNNIHTLGRIKSLESLPAPNTYRYAISGTKIWRRAGDTPGAYTNITGAAFLSGKRATIVSYRPDFSSVPYALIADQASMVKDRCDGTLSAVERWGIMPPDRPAIVETVGVGMQVLDLFDDAATMTLAGGLVGAAAVNRVSTTLSAAANAGDTIVSVASAANIKTGMILTIDPGGANEEQAWVFGADPTGSTFATYLSRNHANGEVVLAKAVSKAAVAAEGSATDIFAAPLNLKKVIVPTRDGLRDGSASNAYSITIWVSAADWSKVTTITIMIDAADGSFTVAWYEKEITADASWAAGYRLFEVEKSEFERNGFAGQPGNDWDNVIGWRVKISVSGAVDLAVDDLILVGGLDGVSGGTSPYDWRYTYYNIVTDEETTPCVAALIPWTTPDDQAVVIQAKTGTGSSSMVDTQVTHVRFYRRGGTLPTGWRKVAQVPIGTGPTVTFVDSLTDSTIAQNDLLEIDNDPPVTSDLRQLVDATLISVVGGGAGDQNVQVSNISGMSIGQYLTVDEGDNEETVVIQAFPALPPLRIRAYFQTSHNSGARLTANAAIGKPLDLCAVAYERVWLAGDQDNPHIVYASKVAQMSNFPPQNKIEVGSPRDPIMALVEFRSALFFFTQSAIYLEPTPGNTLPKPERTAARHGLWAKHAWCRVEQEIWYLAEDGIYAFNGGSSQLVSEEIRWIFRGETLGPVPPMDLTKRSDTTIAYKDREVFVAYTDINGTRRRAIFDLVNRRWRHDSVPANAQLFEDDTAELVISKQANSLVHIDRQDIDYDEAGWSGGVVQAAPIALALQLPSQNLGELRRPKVINGPMLEINTAAQTLQMELILDAGATTLDLGTFNNTKREEVNFTVNNGEGVVSKNIGFRLTGQAKARVNLYAMSIRAAIKPDMRLDFDTYWSSFGLPGWKFQKQAWFRYEAAAAITVSVSIEGESSPRFTFDLPATGGKEQTIRVRLPALKAKMWRITGKSSQPFTLYENSYWEMKSCTVGKGYPAYLLENEQPVGAAA